MNKRTIKFLSAILAILIIFINPGLLSLGAPDDPPVPLIINSIQTDLGQTLSDGQKNVDHDLSYIDFGIDTSFERSYSSSAGNIKVVANGSIDETYKFDISYDYPSGLLSLRLRDSYAGFIQPYKLLKHALYRIEIPQGYFAVRADKTPAQAFVLNFVTDTDEGSYRNDLLASVTPSDGSAGVDDKTASITLEFIDDIAMDDTVRNNIGSYIELASTPFNPAIPSYIRDDGDAGDDSLANYDVTIQDNKLVLSAKAGKLKDFAHYNVILRKNTVYLRDSATKFYNHGTEADGSQIIRFDTDNMLVSTSPSNNEENVPVEPDIRFTFKYPIEIDQGSITFSSDAGNFSVDMDDDSRITLPDEKSFYIRPDDLEGSKIYPLRRSTLYKVTLPQGSVRLPGYTDAGTGRPIENHEINLYFVTRGEGEGPSATAFSSDAAGTDDIRMPKNTRLDGSGSIYIHFDRQVQFDYISPDRIELYKIPKASVTGYDGSGRIYDREIGFYQSVSDSVYRIMPDYVPEIGGTAADLENEARLDRINIGSYDLVNANTLRVTPSFPLDSLAKYKLIIDNSIIEDVNGYNPDRDIEFTFWTRASSIVQTPVWEGLAGTSAQSISENGSVPYKSYTLYGVPPLQAYDPAHPENPHFVAEISTEVIPAADDEDIDGPGVTTAKRITFDALKGITLTEDGNSASVGFSKYRLEYFFDGSVKKTRLHLYPGSALQSGKQYSLNIPAGTFESRSGNDLGALTASFTTEGDRTGQRGVYGLTGGSLRTLDFAVSGEGSFVINGYNFVETVDRVVLIPVSDNIVLLPSITVPGSDVSFINVNSLKVRLRGAAGEELAKESRAGTYNVALYFADRPAEMLTGPVSLILTGRGRPEVTARFPYSPTTGVCFDESSLTPRTIDGIRRYFLSVTFSDPDGTLKFNTTTGLSSLRDNTAVYAQGSGSTMVDTDFIRIISDKTDADRDNYVNQYIFVKDAANRSAVLYIPIVRLRPQTTYNVTVAGEIVFYDGMNSAEGGNDSISWSFATMGIPAINGVSVGSLVEDYDTSVPIALTGDQFYDSSVRVFFNDTEAYRVNVRTDSAGKKYLEVYLPRGSRRLEPGVYNITVTNDSSHTQTLYGSLSIVKEGGRVPDEIRRLKAEDIKGNIYSDLKVSEDTLEIKSKYNDDRLIRLDLDELMGNEVLVRKIKIAGNSRHTIGTLDTKSRYCDITVYGLTLDPAAEGNDMVLELGRVRPAAAQALKNKLGGRAIKSDLVQATGTNILVSGVTLGLPYKDSDGTNLTALRYDEADGSWQSVAFTVDQVEKRAIVTSIFTGIFVVVE